MSYTNVYPNRINWENEPSINTPINETNLNKMDYALYQHDRTLENWDTTKANQSDLLLSVKTIEYDDETGIFIFTWQNGTTKTVDLNIEKIPVSFSMSPQGVITMTTDDGTQYTADVGALIKTYTFNDSSVIDFTVVTDASGNKTITADIVDGSINGNKLQPNYLADCTAAKTAAENAEDSAEDSAEDAEAWAVGERNGVPVDPSDPTYHNNSKYWSQQANPTTLEALTDTDINDPENGQVLTFNGDSEKWENANPAAGGIMPHLVIISDVGSTVTVTYPDGVTTVMATQTPGSTTQWECDVTEFGTYTIDAVLNGDDAQISVVVDTVKIYTIHDEHYFSTLSVYAPVGSQLLVTGGGETYTGTGAGSSAATFTLHKASTEYTIRATVDGVNKTTTVTTSATSGQSVSATIQYGTINLTFDDEFRSSTITCTDGITTITKTAPSSGNTMTFYPPNTGNWSISGVASGVTYTASPDPIVVSSLSTAVTADLQTLAEITVTLYGAKEDTITFTDAAGVAHTEVFASGQTSKSVTLKILPSGSNITFTSSVSKNPSDLSQNYSKNVSLTNNTTAVYVMPDGAIYWYGCEKIELSVFRDTRGADITRNTNNIQYSAWLAAYNTQSILHTTNMMSLQGYTNAHMLISYESATVTPDKYLKFGYTDTLSIGEVLPANCVDITPSTSIQKITASLSGATTDYIAYEHVVNVTANVYAIWLE